MARGRHKKPIAPSLRQLNNDLNIIRASVDWDMATSSGWNLGFHMRALSAPAVRGAGCLGNHVSHDHVPGI